MSSSGLIPMHVPIGDSLARECCRHPKIELLNGLVDTNSESPNTLGGIGQELLYTEHPEMSDWTALSQAIDQFKELLVKADREAIKHVHRISEETCQTIQQVFRDLCRRMHATLGEHAPMSHQDKDEVGARLQREILPYLLLTHTVERCYAKPCGYAGDFLTMELIYQNQPSGFGRLGAVLDQCFLNLPAAQAVRNRRGLLVEEIAGVIEQQQGAVAYITSLACGPAAELFDIFQRLADPAQLSASLIDFDWQALAFVADKRDKAKLRHHMHLINANLIYLALGRQKIALNNQDLVYSVGLIDYLNDNLVIKLINYIYDLLKVGGKVILGNFHPCNPDKVMMDYVLDWKLIHRTEEDLDRLFARSRFKRGCTKIRFEGQGINLFAECIKE